MDPSKTPSAFRVWAGIPLPWKENEDLDRPALDKMIRDSVQTGTEGIYIFGTAGEFYAVGDDDFAICCREFTSAMKPYPQIPIQIGCGTCSLRQTLLRMRIAVDLGCETVQLVLPYWLPVLDSEVISYFQDIHRAFPGTRILIYDNPLAGRQVGADLYTTLIEKVPTIIGAKVIGVEAPLMEKVLKIRPDFEFFATEASFLTLWGKGVTGLLSWMNYAFPKAINETYAALKAGDRDGIARGQKLFDIIQNRIKKEFRPGYRDTNINRLMGVAAGFLDDIFMRVRKPYLSATPEDVGRARQAIIREIGEEYLFENFRKQ